MKLLEHVQYLVYVNSSAFIVILHCNCHMHETEYEQDFDPVWDNLIKPTKTRGEKN